MTLRAALLLSFACAPVPAQTAAQPAPSDYVNQYLPEWLRFSGEARTRYEGFTGAAFNHSANDDHLLTRIRLNLSVRPWSRLSFFVQGQDARVFFTTLRPIPASYQDILDLRLGYVEIGNCAADPISVRAGRQELNFGEQRMLGYNSWRNTAQSFDAVRVILRHGWARFDIFASGPVTVQDRFNRRVPGNNVHGIYGALENRRRRLTVEPYFLWRLSPAWRVENGGFGRLDVKYWGAHAFGKLGAAWDHDTEVAAEYGGSGPDRIRSWAGHWRVGYTSPLGGIRGRWIAEYNYASGDQLPHDGVQGGFTAPYPSQHDRYGLADQIGWKNIHNLHTGAELSLGKRWQVLPSVHNYWVASRTDGVFTSSNLQLARVETGARSNRVGWEADLSAAWKISALLEAGFGYAHIFPGAFLREATPGVPYNFAYCLLNYRF